MCMKRSVGFILLFAVFQMVQAADYEPFAFNDSQLKNRYLPDFQKWDVEDQSGKPDEDTVLCIGSSSMRGWVTIHRDLAPLKVLHRGFGGSSMGPVLLWKNFFLRYPSDTVLIYEGDNDMVDPNMSPELFLDRYREFCGELMSANPDVKIYILSIKPSIARWHLWPKMTAANDLLKAYAAEEGQVIYIDVASGMLGDDGEPLEELLSPKDQLHMTPVGYAVWTERVRSFLLGE